jgi:hypothetical protein
MNYSPEPKGYSINKKAPWIVAPVGLFSAEGSLALPEGIMRKTSPRGAYAGKSYFKRGRDAFILEDYSSAVQFLTKGIKSIYRLLQNEKYSASRKS